MGCCDSIYSAAGWLDIGLSNLGSTAEPFSF